MTGSSLVCLLFFLHVLIAAYQVVGKKAATSGSKSNKWTSSQRSSSNSVSESPKTNFELSKRRSSRKLTVDPFDYGIEVTASDDNSHATSTNSIYAYDDQHYYTYDPGNYADDLPSCYYPTPTTYADLKYCYGHQTRNLPPPCVTTDDLVFNNKTGSFSADQTFYNCMANIPDVSSMPTFFNGKYHGCMLISTQVTLLNLVRVDEVEGVVELQVIIDYVWVDRRYNMVEFWNYVPSTYSGFDITTMLSNDSIVIWRPTIVFPDAQGIEVMAETMTVQASTTPNISLFTYEVTYDLVLVQPGFNFKNYPNDDQDIIIRFSALNFDAEQLQLFPSDVACSYLPDKTCSFASNPLWIWKNEPSFQSCTAYPDQKASQTYPAYVYYSVKIVRQGNGIIVRLVLPLMFLLLLSALTFWVAYDNRVDTTITLLLSVSALYIIILQSIPLVGYLTDVDQFVFWMFLLLCVVVSLHQIYATLYEKVETWPLRLIYMRIIELVGRCFLPPAIIFYFLATIEFGSSSLRDAIMSLVIVSVSGLFIGEMFGVRAAYYHAMELLVLKTNRPDLTTKELSWMEIVMLNRYLFGVWSTSLQLIANEITQKGYVHFEKPTSVTLHNMNSLSHVMGVSGPSLSTPSMAGSLLTKGRTNITDIVRGGASPQESQAATWLKKQQVSVGVELSSMPESFSSSAATSSSSPSMLLPRGGFTSNRTNNSHGSNHSSFVSSDEFRVSVGVTAAPSLSPLHQQHPIQLQSLHHTATSTGKDASSSPLRSSFAQNTNIDSDDEEG